MTPNISEIIRVTIRNRQGVWFDFGICPNVGILTEEIENRFHWKLLYVKSKDYSVYKVIDCLEKAFKEIEKEWGMDVWQP